MRSKLYSVERTLALLLFTGLLGSTRAALVDLTSANRRIQVPGLPDWSKVGFEGGKALPDNSKVAYTLSAAEQDDTAALQNAIKAVESQAVPNGSYRLIQLPAGTINLSYMIYVDTSYLIIRGAGSDPDIGTKIVFRPDADTKYDTIINERWDLDGMKYSWDFPDETANGPGPRVRGCGLVDQSFELAVAKLLVNIHVNFRKLRATGKSYSWDRLTTIGDPMKEPSKARWAVSQAKDKAGHLGTSIVHVNVTNTTWVTTDDLTTTDVWIDINLDSPLTLFDSPSDFLSWGVVTQDWFVNSYIYGQQDWFTITERGTDAEGLYFKLDRPLRFDVYRSSTGDGSTPMEDTETFAKAMPVSHVVHHVGIENLYITQEIDGLRPESAQRNYGNLAPEQSMHGIVFRFARDCWVRGIQTFMTGSHPIATEAARNIQIQDNYFDGAWNKGKGRLCWVQQCFPHTDVRAGGNGYLRGSRVWDSLYYNNTLRNLRHITMQWCAMGNVVILNNMTNDMNLHGGWEGTNLFELNYASVPYSHRSGSCSSCGGESGDQEPGTWFPIWWAAGEKASKWSGASGPQNVFYRNYMIKQEVDGGEYIEYRPYFARDGSLSNEIWQLGWDSQSPAGIRYSHLSLENRVPITDWQSHEKVDFSASPAYGANSFLSDPHTSLFLKDVSAAGGITTFNGIAGNTYCRGDVAPRVAGYYFASASRRSCNPFFPNAIDSTAFTHILFAYGVLARDGTISVAAEDQPLLRQVAALKAKDSSLKVSLAVGGWGLGGDASSIVAIASSASARTKLGTTGATLCSSYGLDGIDLEWAPGISATQWNTIAQAAATGLGSYKLSISTTHAFWSSLGINTVAANLAKVVDFASLITHDVPGTTLEYMNALPRMSSTIAAVHKLGFPRSQIMMGVPFYGRSRQLTNTTCTSDSCPIASGVGLTSQCIASPGLGQGTFPYFAIDSESVDLDTTGISDDLANSAARFITDSGYIIDYETPASVTEKARAATMLCAAGLAVFAMDQDNRNFDLTNAIWGGGALLPSAAEIVSTLKGEPLTAEGLVSTDFWDQAADQILEHYPNLSMELNYQVMILLAVRALDAVASSLYEYLKFSALTEDSFQLYKKWETKALNWALANETGKGNDFWQCSYTDSNYAHDTCPGGHNTPGADVNDVYWRLTDAGGFSSYINDTLGFDTSELIIGNIYVGRNRVDDLLSPTALAGRGKIGRALDRIQESSFLCEAADYTGDVLDLIGLAEPFITTQGITRRDTQSVHGWTNSHAASELASIAQAGTKDLHARAKVAGSATGSLTGYNHCIWHEDFSASYLKDKDYMLRCHENSASYPFKFVAPDGTIKQTTYTDCRPKPATGKATKVNPDWKLGSANRKNDPNIPADPAMCTCDHVLEADELLTAIRRPWFAPSNGADKKDLNENHLSADQAKTLCSQPEYRQFIQNLVSKLNSASNMRPLYNEPNVYKQTFLNPFNLNSGDPADIDPKWQKSAKAGNDERAKYVAIMEEYMDDVKDVRTAVAKTLDAEVQNLKFADADAKTILDSMKLGPRSFDVVGDGKPESFKQIGRIEEIKIRNTRDYAKKLEATTFRPKPAAGVGSVADADPVAPNNKRKGSPDSGPTDP
ncbi:hypothetical protein FRC07_005677, partial [Ceratobasidium sp. 392]